MLRPAKPSIAGDPNHLLLPQWAEIVKIVPETKGVFTLLSRFRDAGLQSACHYAPGQFDMLYVPGYGEAAISISSHADHQGGLLAHTVRIVGSVTGALSRLHVGDAVGIRGPFGLGWPLRLAEGKDIVLVGGGTGLPSLRPVIYEMMRQRDHYGDVTVLYGARTAQDLLYADEYDNWRQARIHMEVTVDRGDPSWEGRVGVVPMSFYYLQPRPGNTVVMTCGPETMIRFVVYEALARRIPAEQIFISLERNMKCGQGSCGHCQLGPFFVCKDGPVFPYAAVASYFNVEEF